MTYQKVSLDASADLEPIDATILADAELAPSTRVGIVVSQFNKPITHRLLAAAVTTLRGAGIAADAIDVAWVPGSFELPLAADRLASTGQYAGVICLGCRRDRTGLPCMGHSDHFWSADVRNAGASDRPRGWSARQQGRGSRRSHPCHAPAHANAHPAPKHDSREPWPCVTTALTASFPERLNLLGFSC
jgi:hypothetical protein